MFPQSNALRISSVVSELSRLRPLLSEPVESVKSKIPLNDIAARCFGVEVEGVRVGRCETQVGEFVDGRMVLSSRPPRVFIFGPRDAYHVLGGP